MSDRIGIRERLGWPDVGGHRRFVTAIAIDAVGSGVFMPVSVLYFLATPDLDLVAEEVPRLVVPPAVPLGRPVRLDMSANRPVQRSVMVGPGLTALMKIPSGAISRARPLVRASRAALAPANRPCAAASS